MSKIFKIASLLAVFAMVACVEDVDPGKLGLNEKLIVVNSLISPQSDVLEVEVSWSRSVFGLQPDYGSNEDIITTAQVVISNGNNSVTLPYVQEEYLYKLEASQFPILTGQTYELEVSVGNETVTASATVPQPVSANGFSITSGSNNAQRATVSWEDLSGQENFYRINTVLLDENREEQASIFFDTDEYQSDVNRDGTTITARGETYFFGSVPDFVEAKALLISCDENYYYYHKDYNIFQNDDPFSEAVQSRSNIEGGVGIFAAYQLTETIVSTGD